MQGLLWHRDLRLSSILLLALLYSSCTSDSQFGCPKRNNPDARYHSVSFTFDSVASFFTRLNLDPQKDT